MTAERVSEAELHAFVDDELDAARHAAVAEALQHDPALAARVAAYAADRDRLRTALGAAAARPLPPDWARRIETATARAPRSPLTRRTAMAASLVLALALGGAAIATRAILGRDSILEAARAARENQAAGRPVPPPILADAGARDAVLRTVLGMRVRAPDLQRFGFHLARLDVFTRAAQLRYGDARGRALTIYVRPSDGNVRFDLLRHGADRVCVWQDDVVGAVIIAPIAAGEMLRVAGAAYADLNL